MHDKTPEATVLIIDDNPSAAKTLKLVLSAEGYAVDCAGTAAEALRMAERRSYDGALIDVSLPDRSGIEVLEDLKRLFPDLVSIIVTGHSSAETSIEALNRGANGYVRKPVEVQQLLSLLRSGLEKKRLEEANWRMLRRLSLLHVIGTTVSVGLEPRRTLAETVSLVVSLLDMAAGAIWWHHGPGKRPELVAAVGMPDGLAEKFTDRVACLLDELEADPELYRQPWFDLREECEDGAGEWQFRLISLKGQKDTMGCMAVGGRNWFGAEVEEAEVLGAVAGQVGVAMENMRLYEDLRIAHQQHQQTQAQLVQAEKLSAVGRAVSGVAHEINNPLTAIMGYGELLAESEGGSMAQDLGQRIYSQAKRCTKIVQDLLQFSRQHVRAAELVDVGELIRVCLDELDEQRGESAVVTHLDPDLPPVMADREALRQVFVNIIANAYQAMQPEGGALTVSSAVNNGHAVLTFADSGPGIADDVITRVFDPFFTTKSVGEGTGLGLSVSHAIVREHGGDIHTENRPEGGAVFSVHLPIRRPDGPGWLSPDEAGPLETEGVTANADPA